MLLAVALPHDLPMIIVIWNWFAWSLPDLEELVFLFYNLVMPLWLLLGGSHNCTHFTQCNAIHHVIGNSLGFLNGFPNCTVNANRLYNSLKISIFCMLVHCIVEKMSVYPSACLFCLHSGTSWGTYSKYYHGTFKIKHLLTGNFNFVIVDLELHTLVYFLQGIDVDETFQL